MPNPQAIREQLMTSIHSITSYPDLFCRFMLLVAYIFSVRVVSKNLHSISISILASVLYLFLRWSNDESSVKNMTSLRGSLTSSTQVPLDFSSLKSFTCVPSLNGTQVTCSRVFTCQAHYTFQPDTVWDSTTKVVVIVRLPSAVKWFK